MQEERTLYADSRRRTVASPSRRTNPAPLRKTAETSVGRSVGRNCFNLQNRPHGFPMSCRRRSPFFLREEISIRSCTYTHILLEFLSFQLSFLHLQRRWPSSKIVIEGCQFIFFDDTVTHGRVRRARRELPSF